jgi:hypothetical protein
MSVRSNLTGTITAAVAAFLLAGCAVGNSATVMPVASTRADVTAAAAIPAAAQVDASSGQPPPTATTRQDFPAGIRTVTVSDASGDIAVTGVDGDRVTLVRQVYAHSAKPPETIAPGASELRIDAPHCTADEGLQPCRIDYEIQVPRGTVVSLTSASGNLALTGVNAVQSAVAASGNVTVTGSAGPVTARSTSGNVTVQAAAVAESLIASAVSGNAKVAVPAGHYRVETSTASGDRDVSIVNEPVGALIQVTSVSGNVDLGTSLDDDD